jgi:hypothetical protein
MARSIDDSIAIVEIDLKKLPETPLPRLLAQEN